MSIAYAGAGHATVYGAFSSFGKQSQPFLSLAYSSPGKLIRDTTELETRIVDPSTQVPAQPCIYVHRGHTATNDLSPLPGKYAGEYRIYLALGYAHNNPAFVNTDRSASANLVARALDIGSQPELLAVPLTEQPAGTHMHLTLSGEATSTAAGANAVTMLININGSDPDNAINMPNAELLVPETPIVFPLTGQPKSIEFQTDLPWIALPKGERTVKIELSSAAPCRIKNLRVAIQPETLPSFANHTVVFH